MSDWVRLGLACLTAIISSLCILTHAAAQSREDLTAALQRRMIYKGVVESGILPGYDKDDPFFRSMPSKHVDAITQALQRSSYYPSDDVVTAVNRALQDAGRPTNAAMPRPFVDEKTCQHPGRLSDAAAIDAVIESCTRTIAAGGNSFSGVSSYYLYRSRLYARKGDRDRATADCDSSARTSKMPDAEKYKELWASECRGMMYRYMGDFDRGIAELNEALRQWPQYNIALLGYRGQIYHAKGDFTRALADYDQVIAGSTGAGTWQALTDRGFSYLKLGQTAKAATDYEAVLKDAAASASALFGRGITKLRQGNAYGGNADIAAAMGFQPDIADEVAWFYDVKP